MSKDTDNAVNTAKKQRGKPFAKGKSGNPSGRPKGSRNKTTLAAMQLLGNEAEEITKILIEKAKQGDMAAIKLVIERVCPVNRNPVSINLQNIKTFDDLVEATDQLAQAVSQGEIAPADAQMVANLIDQQRKTIICSRTHMLLSDF